MAHYRYTRYLVLAVLIFAAIYLSGITKDASSKYLSAVGKAKPTVEQDHIIPDQSIPPEGQPEPEEIDLSILKTVPAVSPGHQDRVNATFVTLVRDSDLWEIARSIRQVEDRFNHNYHYDWVFLNDGTFSNEFRRTVSGLVSGRARFGRIGQAHWSYPPWIDQSKAAQTRKEMKEAQVIYGDSESYRHMCRFESGFFFQQPMLQEYDYYWRVEPSVNFYCDLPYDPFRFMMENKKKYSFVIALHEYEKTVPTLWSTTKKFMKEYPEHIADNNLLEFISNNNGKSYNLCHFWSNFEIGSLEFLRSKAYLDYFNFLDKAGGFFYERWGDAPVHSIAAALMLDKSDVHFFDDIGYKHAPFTHCPNNPETRLALRCDCDPRKNVDWRGHSCLNRYFDVTGLERPKGYENAPKN